MSAPFDAVIFDCDGVLVDSEILAVEVELALLGELGLPYEERAFKARFLGMHDLAFRDAIDADCRARTGAPLPAGFLDEVHARRRRAVSERLREVSGAAAAVGALALPKAVASSTGAAFLQRKLALTGLWPLFDPHAYSADLVPNGKPAPDIFLYAAEAIGVAPARCLALEDSANGVRAAVAAGMTAWGFTGGGHCDDDTAAALIAAGAERVLAHWDEAADQFARW
jgi:HAD superfamily hydrolase (TIGR01509 family)